MKRLNEIIDNFFETVFIDYFPTTIAVIILLNIGFIIYCVVVK